jgi:ubiquinone/menaquinone biosynthesis C-methylase UbiE
METDMELPDWWYDDRRQVGVDFEDAAQVATYDARQGGSAKDERALLQRLGAGPDSDVADIGCGTGLLICEAARMCRSAVGIDVSAAMLAAARARAEALGCERLSFQRAGFLTFAAPDQSFDLVTTKAALHHLPDFWKAVAFARVHAALRPGGRFYIRDVMFNDPPQRLAETAEAWVTWLAANTGYAREEAACHIREEHSTFAWVIERLLTDCGFRILERRHEGVGGLYSEFVTERA